MKNIKPLELLAEAYLEENDRKKQFKYMIFKEYVLDMEEKEERDFYCKLGLGFCKFRFYNVVTGGEMFRR